MYSCAVKLRTLEHRLGMSVFLDVHLEHGRNIELRTCQHWELRTYQIMCIVKEKKKTTYPAEQGT